MDKRVYHKNFIKDTMYNLAPDSGASIEYTRGLIIGLVSGLMYNSLTFTEAIKLITEHEPANARMECYPPSWRFDREKVFGKENP